MIILLVFVTYILCSNVPLIVDHDGGVDDVIATLLQLVDNYDNVKAITVVPADSYPEPDVFVMKKLFTLFPNNNPIPVGISTNVGTNPFPDGFRVDAYNAARIPLWVNESGFFFFYKFHPCRNSGSFLVVTNSKCFKSSCSRTRTSSSAGCSKCIDYWSLYKYSRITHKKARFKDPNWQFVYNGLEVLFLLNLENLCVGGAVNVPGNVRKDGHDGSAEWNIYNNPEAFDVVLKSGLSITLIPLDATVYAPISDNILSTLKFVFVIYCVNVGRFIYKL
jgi:purine nucleosidase